MQQQTKILPLDLTYFIKQVEVQTGFDFSEYSESSLTRRVERLMQIWNFKTIHELIVGIKTNKQLLQVVINEITVNTTEMFRDPEVWVDIVEQIKNLGSNKLQLGLRIWHTACSRGDEVFSMLIVLNELNLINDAKLVATDINKKVLLDASEGKLHIANFEQNKKNFQKVFLNADFNKYFTRSDGTYHYFNSELLKQVSFKPHNLNTDDAIGLFDVVLCRNVLIYFNIKLQDKVLNTLVKALKTNGLLIIGSKESLSLSDVSKQVTTVNSLNKIYKKNYII
jgi:chemotaxis protein methyltransferase CheR